MSPLNLLLHANSDEPRAAFGCFLIHDAHSLSGRSDADRSSKPAIRGTTEGRDHNLSLIAGDATRRPAGAYPADKSVELLKWSWRTCRADGSHGADRTRSTRLAFRARFTGGPLRSRRPLCASSALGTGRSLRTSSALWTGGACRPGSPSGSRRSRRSGRTGRTGSAIARGYRHSECKHTSKPRKIDHRPTPSSIAVKSQHDPNAFDHQAFLSAMTDHETLYIFRWDRHGRKGQVPSLFRIPYSQHKFSLPMRPGGQSCCSTAN